MLIFMLYFYGQDITDSYVGYKGVSRVAIAQREDWIILFSVTDVVHGRRPTLKEVSEFLKLYRAYNIANLDDGTFLQIVIDNK